MKRKVTVICTIFKELNCDIEISDDPNDKIDDFQPIWDALHAKEGDAIEGAEINMVQDVETGEYYF